MHKKKTITQDIIYVVWHFAYVHEIVVISLFTKKKIQDSATHFSLLKQYIKP